MSMPRQPDRWGSWLRHDGAGAPAEALGEWVWIKQRDGGSHITSGSTVHWPSSKWEDDEDIMQFRLRDDHPIYHPNGFTLPPSHLPTEAADELMKNPLWGSF